MEIIDDILTETELKLEEEFKQNYIKYMALFISDNVNSIYKYYKNNSDFSFNNVILMSKDTWNLNEEDKKILISKIDEILNSTYKIHIVSDYDEKLKLEKCEV